MAAFKVGKLYSVQDVHDAVGGECQTYLPQRNHRIVAGRFSRQMNPLAPEFIYPEDKPQVRRKARMLLDQDDPIPVFVKERKADKLFVYLGRYRATRLSGSKAELTKASQLSGRKTLAYVMTLERVGD